MDPLGILFKIEFIWRKNMADQVSSDIFKFMALRPPQNFSHEKDVITIIRDPRIQQVHLPDEAHSVEEDAEKFSNSAVANYVFGLVKEYLEEIEADADILSLSDHIAENVKGEFSIYEKTQRPMIDEFVALIKQHLMEFNKKQLIAGLNEIVKKYLDNSATITDYMEAVVSESNVSAFCLDFEYLFERLYALYVCKRLFPINLEYVIDGLKALHIIRLLRYIDVEKPFGALPSIPIGDTSGRGRTDCALRQLIFSSGFMPQVGPGANGRLTIPKIDIKTKDDLAFLFSATPYIHQLLACLLGYYKPFNNIRPIGIGDLLVVKQFLCKYEAGEIAHVENVLKGERKERSHRRLDRTEDIFATETDKTEETERELQSTDRFELKNETEKTIQTDLSAEIGTSVSGSYGAVEYSANAGVSFSLSTSESRRNTNNFAKDIVDRSVTRIQKHVREERSTKKLYEVEEINEHELDNTKGDAKHISGIYRWLDKRYKAQVFNYGKRLMFEFVVPEPAKFIAAAFEQNKKRQSKPDDPKRPDFPALDISQISDATVNTYTAKYHIDDLEPSPASELSRSIPMQSDKANDKEAFAREYQMEVPENYEAKQVKIVGGIKFNDTLDDSLDTPNYFSISIGDHTTTITGGDTPATSAMPVTVDFTGVSPISSKVGVSVLAVDVLSFAVTVTVKFALKSTGLRSWQIKTYQRIMDAYEKLLAEYNSSLAEYQDKLEGYNVSQGIMIRGRNPRINQDIIKTELKKHCITMITKQFDVEKNDDLVFDSMKSRKEMTTGSSTEIEIPAIDIPEALEEGSIIQFLEQAFEWPQISYLLYPYFWGRLPEQWFEAQKYYDEEDPLYAKFLQAGSARVLIAVRPAYEIAVMHYLCTKKPWNGGPGPGINHPLYIPIHEELRNQQDDLNGAEPYGDSWEVVIPTSLVYLQESAELPTYDCNPPVKKKKPTVQVTS
jgi:hypothetical protein